jgi:RNA polymerase sigma factor (sigma-70 family)
MTMDAGDPPSDASAEDAGLLQRWKDGDLDAADELIGRHFAMIYRFFASKVRAEATDLTQQTFAKAVETVDTVHTLSSFRAYLMAIARNLLYSHLRVRSGWRGQVEPIGSSLPGAMTSPSQAAARQQMRALIGAALRRLPLDLQIVLELHYWEGLTLREVADVFAIPEGTVKSRMNRGLNLLRGHVDEMLLQHRLPQPVPSADLDAWSAGLRQLFGSSDTPV